MMIQYTTFRFKFDKIFYSAIIVKHNKGGEIEKMEFNSKKLIMLMQRKRRKQYLRPASVMPWNGLTLDCSRI